MSTTGACPRKVACWIFILFIAGCGAVWGSPNPQNTPSDPVASSSWLGLSPDKIILDANLGASLTLTKDIDVSSNGVGTPLTYTASIQSGGDWILLGTAVSGTTVTWGSTVTATTPAVLRVFVKVNALPAGMNHGIIALRVSGSTAAPIVLPVFMNVRGKPSLIVYPTKMVFSHQAANTYNKVAQQSLSVYGSSTHFSVRVATSTGEKWLLVSPSSATTPANLQVSIDATGMDPGIYDGTISIHSPDARYGDPSVAVQLTVTQSASLFAAPASISLRAQYGSHQPVSDTAQIYTNGFILPVSASVQEQSWLSATVQDSWAGEFDAATTSILPTPARIKLFADPTGLAVGTYTSSIIVGDETTGVTVPVTLRIQPNNLVIPHIVDGGGTATVITLVNTDREPAPFKLKLRQQDGSPLVLPLDLGGAASEYSGVIPVGGIRVIHTVGSGADVTQGWAEIIPERSIGVTTSFMQLGTLGLAEAALPAASPQGTAIQLPFDNTDGAQTQFAVVNYGPADTSVSVIMRDEDGTELAVTSFAVPPHGRGLLRVPDQLPQLVNQRGLAELRSSGGALSAVGLRITPEGTVVTHQPVMPLSSASNMVQIIPLAVDGFGWSTSLVLTNPGSQPMPYTISFKNPAPGIPLVFPLASVGNVGEYSDVIPAGGIRILNSAETPGVLTQGWAEIASAGRIGATLIFTQNQGVGASSSSSMPIPEKMAADFIVPFDNSSGLSTSLALLNNAAVDGLSTVKVRDEHGKWITTNYMTVSADTSESFYLSSLFPATDGIRGTLEFSGAKFLALALRFSSLGSFTSLAPVNK